MRIRPEKEGTREQSEQQGPQGQQKTGDGDGDGDCDTSDGDCHTVDDDRIVVVVTNVSNNNTYISRIQFIQRIV